MPPIVLNDWAAHDLGVPRRRSADARVLRLGGAGPLGRTRSDFRVAAVVPIAGPPPIATLAPVYPGITESATLARLGSAVSARSAPRPPDRRGLLEASTARHRRRSSRSRRARRCGARGTAIEPRCELRAAGDQSLAAARERFAARLRAALDPLRSGLAVQRRPGRRPRRLARRDRFRRILHLFQFLPRRVGAAACRAVLQARHRAARARSRAAARGRLHHEPRSARCSPRKGSSLTASAACSASAGAIGYACGDDGRPPLVVERRGRHHGADAARVGRLARRRRRRRRRRRDGVHLVDAAHALADLRAQPAGRARSTPEAVPARETARQDAAVGGRRVRRPRPGAASRRAPPVRRTGPGRSSAPAHSCSPPACVSSASTLGVRRGRPLGGHGWWPARPGSACATPAYRPARSVLVDGGDRGGDLHPDLGRCVPPRPRCRDHRPHSGTGGYALMVELVAAARARSEQPRRARGAGADGVRQTRAIEPFRVLPGDDASCLNLYEPRQSDDSRRARGVSSRPAASRFRALVPAKRRGARESVAAARPPDADEDQMPVVPVIADANSMTYVLHKALGDDIVIDRGGRRVRLRFVAALGDSVLQSELVMSEANFLRLFPDQEGYQLLLVETPAADVRRVKEALDEGHARLRRRCGADRRRGWPSFTASRTPTLDVPDARRPGPAARDDRSGRRPAAQRARAAQRAGAARRGRVSPGQLFAIVLAENVLLLSARAGDRRRLRRRRGRAGARRARRAADQRGGWMLLAGVFVTGLISSAIATRAALRTPCWPRCGRSSVSSDSLPLRYRPAEADATCVSQKTGMVPSSQGGLALDVSRMSADRHRELGDCS